MAKNKQFDRLMQNAWCRLSKKIVTQYLILLITNQLSQISFH